MINTSTKAVSLLLLTSYVVASASANPVTPVKEITCPDWSTHCKAPLSEDDGCCPYNNATCCVDGKHCCPAGFYCDMKAGHGWCINKLYPSQKHELVSTRVHLDANTGTRTMLAVAQITCPDGSTCPLNHFCCRYGMYGPENLYSCCPANTVCCVDSGTPQCCPNGYVCNGKQCSKTCAAA